jgi:hypothetical protein
MKLYKQTVSNGHNAYITPTGILCTTVYSSLLQFLFCVAEHPYVFGSAVKISIFMLSFAVSVYVCVYRPKGMPSGVWYHMRKY